MVYNAPSICPRQNAYSAPNWTAQTGQAPLFVPRQHKQRTHGGLEGYPEHDAQGTGVVTSETCSRQVNRLLLRSASVSKDSALAASCELLAAGGVGRAQRGSSTQRATPRGLDCCYRVPHLAR